VSQDVVEPQGSGRRDAEGLRVQSREAPLASESATIDDEERARRKQELDDLFELMRPAVQQDGGDIVVVDADYQTGVVEVQLQGACGSCAISAVTLRDGVERLLKDRLSWVSEIIGGVDESIDPFESAAMGRGGYVPWGQ
jgi:Fe-S cluster biogenesis protein NfuA